MATDKYNAKGKIDNNLNIEGMIKETVRIPVSNDALVEFTIYCSLHPELRFWQALKNWTGVEFILFSEVPPKSRQRDTFYFKGKSS